MFWTKNSPAKFLPKRVVDALDSNFSDDELIELSRVATLVDVPAGSTLTVEGTLGSQALVLVEGSASVVRDGETIATLAGGEIIGEMALLSGQPRSATVVTETDATVYAMSPRDFASLLVRCPRLEQRVTALAVRRLTTT